MTTPNGERRSPEPTSAELARLRAIRESIAEELPDLVARDQLLRTARGSGRSAGPCGTRFTGVNCRSTPSRPRRACHPSNSTSFSRAKARCHQTRSTGWRLRSVSRCAGATEARHRACDPPQAAPQDDRGNPVKTLGIESDSSESLEEICESSARSCDCGRGEGSMWHRARSAMTHFARGEKWTPRGSSANMLLASGTTRPP